MMRMLHWGSGLLLLVLAYIGLGATAWIAGQVGLACQLVRRAGTDWPAPLLGAVAILLLLLLWLYCGRLANRPDDVIEFRGRGGRIRLSTASIRDFIENVVGEFAAVQSLFPRLSVRRGKLEVELEIRVIEGTRIPELCEVLQDSIRDGLNDRLGLTRVRGIQVAVKEILPSGGATKPLEDPEGATA